VSSDPLTEPTPPAATLTEVERPEGSAEQYAAFNLLSSPPLLLERINGYLAVLGPIF